MIIVDYNDIGIKRGLWQYDFGQVLRIQGGNLKSAVEIHFSLQETGGEAVTRIGTTKDGVTDVVIPDTMLINDDIDDKYNIYVFIYIADRESGETEKKFALEVKSRPKPEAFDATEDKKLFEEAIKAVNESAERAETAEQQAAKHAEQTKADAQKTTADRQEVEQHVLEVAGDKSEVERLATQVRQDKSSVEQTVQGFGNTAQQAIQSVQSAGTQAVREVNTTKSNAVKAVQTEGEKQAEAVQAKGQEVINSIPSDYTTLMATKLDKQQGTENAGKALVIGEDGNVVPGEVQSGGMKLLVRYTHKANGSMKLSNLDLQTGIFTTSEPHGLKENTALYIKPLAGCYPKHIPIEIFKNNPGQWGRGNIYAHVIDETHFQILSKKDGDILLFTDSANSEVDVKYFTFEYNMKKITLDNINSRVIDVVANGICSGGYFTVRATTNYGNTYSTRISSNTYSFFSTGQTPAHYHYACRMMFDKGIVTATIPIVAMSLDGTSYSNNNVNKIGRMYTRTVFGMGMEANPNAEKENGYIKSIHPFADEVYPFNGAYVEIWGYDE